MIKARTNYSNHMNSSRAAARRNAAVYLRKDLRPSTRTEKHKYNQSRAYVIARVLEILIQTQSVFTGTYALRNTQNTEPTIRAKTHGVLHLKLNLIHKVLRNQNSVSLVICV